MHYYRSSLTIIIAVLASTSLALPSLQATPQLNATYEITCLDKDTSGDYGWCAECTQLIADFGTDAQVPKFISINRDNQPYNYRGPYGKQLAQCVLELSLKQGAVFDVTGRSDVAKAATAIVSRCVWEGPEAPLGEWALGGFAAPLGGQGKLIVKVNKVNGAQISPANSDGPALVATT